MITRQYSIAIFLALLTPGLPALAQLDATCTVSVLNRTAPVDAGGVWVLPNVPTNMGQVRVRATCMDGNVVRSGQSDFFTVPANGVVEVADIVFDAPEPIPARLTLTAPVGELTATGQTVELSAVATLPDGSTRDVTSPTAGTTYSVSNPAVATVDAGGEVTAVASGTVLVSALHEGTLALLTLRVVVAADSDGDGLPDDFEIQNGLDPNNGADAFLDADEDGLTIVEEFQAGLDPFNPDSDGDGLLDGRELGELGTDPLLADSDGDLVPDGLEIDSGSDPLDRNSVFLPPILAALTVEPASFELVFNTAIGESSRRLRVTATLVDGTVLDATGAPYGTSYGSSDLAVASFGLDPGRVFAGEDGTATLTASNGAINAGSEVTVRTFAPRPLSFVPIPGFANAVDVDGGLAVVAAGERGLWAVDVTDLEAPAVLGSVATPGNANDVRLAGDVAYVADGARGLTVVDVSNPANALVVASVDTPGDATDLVVAGNLLYLADGSEGLRVFEVSDALAPILLAALDTPGNARGLDVDGDFLLLADEGGGVHVVDVADAGAPRLAGSVHTRPGFSRAADVVIQNRRAFVADGASEVLGGLRIIDFRVPSTPVVVGSTGNRFGLVVVAVEDDLVLAADYFFANAVPIFGVATGSPAFQALLDFSGPPAGRDDNGTDLVVRDGVVFLTGTRFSFRDNGGLGEGGLHIGRYRTAEGGGPAPPSVALTSPSAGDVLLERRLVTLRADADDDVRVGRVEFLIGDEVVRRDFTAPFEHTFRLPPGPASLVVGARATDLDGRQAQAEEVVLTVVPDGAPTVELLSPAAGQRVTEGSVISVAVEATDDEAVAAVELRVDGVALAALGEAPYLFELAIPLGGGDLTLAAVVTDGGGQTAATEPRVLGVDADPPPEVVILSPVDGGRVVRGARIPIVLGVIDNREVSGAFFRVDGVGFGEDFEPPWEESLEVPVTASELTFDAQVFDAVGQSGSSTPVVVTAIDDPLTTVVAEVVFGDDAGAPGTPVAGARVRCLAALDPPLLGESDAGGAVTIAGVPTRAGPVSCQADFTDAGGTVFAGTSAAAVAVPAGVTDVGTIRLAPSPVLEDLGFSLDLEDDDDRDILLPFLFPFFDTFYDLAFVNSNGTLSFEVPSPFDSTEDREEFATGLRDLDGSTGPTIAPFWDDLAPQADGGPVARNVFVDDRTPGRVVVTWNEVPEHPGVGSNTFQVVLHEDGRIEFVYVSMSADDAIVGLSPVLGEEPLPPVLRGGVSGEKDEGGLLVDWSAEAPLSTSGPITVFEEFDGPDGPDGRGEDPPGERPFDLDGRRLIFVPNLTGGYDATLE